jgi:uncharacterized protein YjaZ
LPLEYHLGYTKQQLRYCGKNAEAMWAFLASEQLFFGEDFFQIRKFFGESPTIGNFPDSPGRIGWFFGYKIVKKYREKTGISLKQLFENKDSRKWECWKAVAYCGRTYKRWRYGYTIW